MTKQQRTTLLYALALLAVLACARSRNDEESAMAGTSGTSGVLKASFRSIYQNILVVKCKTCHTGTSAPGNWDVDTYTHVMEAVDAGSPTSSPLYQRVKSGDMPRTGNRLTSQELSSIATWIKNGAKNN